MHEITSEQITGASYPLTLESGGEETTFQVYPLNDRDQSELNYWIQSRILDTAYSHLPVDTPENMKLRDRVIAIAQREAAGAAWNNPVGSKILDTNEGQARLLWQASKDVKDKIKHTSLMVYFLNPMNMKKFLIALVKTSPSMFNPAGSEIDWSDLEEEVKPRVELEDISKKKSTRRKAPKNSKNSKN